jgi:hypothetical protein
VDIAPNDTGDLIGGEPVPASFHERSLDEIAVAGILAGTLTLHERTPRGWDIARRLAVRHRVVRKG